MMTKETILQAFEFYRLGSAAERAEMLRTAVYGELPPSTPFYREGDVCASFALVGRGDIRVFKSAATGREITLYHVRDREPCLINMLCVFLGCPTMASATALNHTQAVLVPAPVFRHWITVNEAVRGFVFATMASRLVEVMTLVQEISLRKMDARLASLLVRKRTDGGDRVIRITHDGLAEELGTAREVVSRVLKEMEHAGAVHLDRSRITILDERALLDVVNDPSPAIA